MERLLKWLLPTVLVVNIALMWSGVFEAGTAILIVVGLELLAGVLSIRQIMVAVRRYKEGKAAGLDVEAAMEDGLAVLLPRRVARLVAIEPRIWMYLFRWLFRRRALREGEFSYNKRSPLPALLAIVVVTAPVELLLAELLIPWEAVRWIVVVLSVYSAVWLFGYVASLQVLPHHLNTIGVRLRYGIMADSCIPYGDIEEVRIERRTGPQVTEGLKVLPKERSAYLAVGGRTDLVVRLKEARTLQGLLSETEPVHTLYIAADKPEQMGRALQARIALAGVAQ